MKIYKIYIFFLFLIFFFFLKQVNSINYNLLGKIIVLDPGHGGIDPGAIYYKTNEKDINLDIAIDLKNKLENKGAIVFLTRTGDYDLSSIDVSRRKKSDFNNRIKLINSIDPELVISIHLNAEDTGLWKGLQIFYSNTNSKEISEEITSHLKTKRKPKKINDIYLFDNLKQKSIIIEYGFISNSEELSKLKNKTYISNINDSITEALEALYNS